MTKSIFASERLYKLYTDLKSGADVKSVQRLSIDDLAKVPEIYGALDPNGLDIPSLDNEQEFTTANKNVILGKDIKALTAMIYEKPRTAYVDFGRKSQVHEALASGATPLALLGFKRFRGIDYDKWRRVLLRDTTSRVTYTGRKLDWAVTNDEDIVKFWKLDMLLGKTLASTYYDPSTDSINWNQKFGLMQASTLEGRGWMPDAITVRFLREAGIGNHRGNFATAWGTARISEDRIPDKVDKDIIRLWNASDNPVRLLISQRWVWFGQHRCSDNICSILNWDEMPENIDKVSTGFKGNEPKEQEKDIRGLFGL